MTNITDKYDNEIDLLNVIKTIWDGKWKIAFIISVSLLPVIGFNILKPSPPFTALTEIKPITSLEFDKYLMFNSSLKFIEKKESKITKETLLTEYVEQIEEGSILETAIDKYNLINKDNFDSESDYNEAVGKFASKIEVLKPIKNKNETRLHHVLSAEYDDKDKWKDLLAFVNNEANRRVKATIINRFKTIASLKNQKKDFAIKDIEIKIDNVKEVYQAAIARNLDISKNTINNLVFNFRTNAPYYHRGYIAIEEEIKQIKNRKYKNSYTNDLIKLDQQKREIERDTTIDMVLDLFNKTPLNKNNFEATIFKVATTEFEEFYKFYLYYALAIILGGIIGVLYVLIANAIQNYKNNIFSS